MMLIKPQTVYKTIEVVKQTLDELIQDNNEFLELLKEFYGDEAKNSFINYLREELNFVPRSGTKIGIELQKLGLGTLIFYPYTTEVKFGVPKDPINLIFYGKGSDTNVQDIMCHKVSPNWYHVKMSHVQYTYIDNSIHGGQEQWIKVNHALSNKPDPIGLFRRRHIRIFGSQTRCNHGYNDYCIASVHEDTLKSHWASPIDFDNSQLEVENVFAGINARANPHILQPAGEIINGVQHDGIATAIEITTRQISPGSVATFT